MSDRYRFVQNGDGTCEWIIDNKEWLRESLEGGTTRISACSFSAPIDGLNESPFCFGDLHFYIPLSSGRYSEIESVFNSLVRLADRYALELEQIGIYRPYAGVLHFVIPESAFQGELGFKYRGEVDRQLFVEFFGAQYFSYLNNYLVVHGQSVLMLPIMPDSVDLVSEKTKKTYSELMVSSSFEEGILPAHTKRFEEGQRKSRKCSLLALQYMWFVEDLSKTYSIRAQKINVGTLSRCSVFESARWYWSHLSESEKEFLKKCFGRFYFPKKSDEFLIDGHNFSCRFIRGFLNERTLYLSCSECCPVTTPLAYLVYRDVGLDLHMTSTGVFKLGSHLRHDPLGPPIWIESNVMDRDKKWGVEVCAIDKNGAKQPVVLSQKEFSSPKLFSLLKQYDVVIPIAKQEKGAMRRWLKDFSVKKEKELKEIAGWVETKVGGLTFVFPKGHALPGSSQFAFKTLELAGVKKVKGAPIAVKESKVVNNWQVVHCVASKVPYLSFFLSLLKSESICLHFYTKDKSVREAFMECVSYNWQVYFPKVFYSVKEVLRNDRELLRGSCQSFLCVGDILEGDVDTMQEVLYKLFKKEKETPLSVFSVGEVSLATGSEVESSFDILVRNNRLMAINIDISNWNELVSSSGLLSTDQVPAVLMNINDEKIQEYKNTEFFSWRVDADGGQESVTDRAIDFLSILSLILRDEFLFTSMNDVGMIHFGMENVTSGIDRRVFRSNDSKIYNGAMCNLINGLLSSTFGVIEYNYPVVPHEQGDCLFVPASDLKELVGSVKGYRAFLSWLTDKNFFTEINGATTGVMYYKKYKKSVRGYYVNIKSLMSLQAMYMA